MSVASRSGRLGLLLAGGPRGSLARASVVCGDALDRGAEVYAYCVHEGTRWVRSEELQSLRARGLRLFACAYGARRRGMALDDSAVFGGLGLLEDILISVERFASLSACGEWEGGDAGGGSGRRQIWLCVATDPLVDESAAEGVRIAEGLRAGGRLDVALAFEGEGVRCGLPEAEGFVDGLAMVRNLSDFLGAGGAVWVESGPAAAQVAMLNPGARLFVRGERPWARGGVFAVLSF